MIVAYCILAFMVFKSIFYFEIPPRQPHLPILARIELENRPGGMEATFGIDRSKYNKISTKNTKNFDTKFTKKKLSDVMKK